MAFKLRHSDQSDWSDAAWDAFVSGHPTGHPLQTSAWGQLKRAFGWEDVRLGLFEGETLVAGAQLLFRKLPRLRALPLRVAYVPKGPVVDWNNPAQVQALFDGMHKLVRRRFGVLLKLEPEAADTPELTAKLQRLGFQPGARTVQPRTTVWLDLRPDEDALLAAMKQKWRYNIRLAERKDVRVRQGGPDDIDAFVRLMQTTGDRNEFAVHEPAYYRHFWELFAPRGWAALFLAEHEGQTLAALMAARLGQNAYYFYGASGNENRQLMPSHLLQWETMRWAKTQGCTGYDLWGIPDEVGLNPDAPIPDPPTGLWGVWRFKNGFGGQVVRYTGAWDHTYLPLLRQVGRIAHF